jgi:hypothetical protein
MSDTSGTDEAVTCRCSEINLGPVSNEGPNPDCPIHGDAVATNWERLATGYDH